MPFTQPSDASPSSTNILMISAGIIFFVGLFVIVGIRLCAWHRGEQGTQSRQEPVQGSHLSRVYLRRLSVAMFGDPQLLRHNLPSRQEEKLGFGLEASVFENLPTFTFKQTKESNNSNEEVDCSVCLEHFADGEKGRILPKCGHCFHADCVDMWFFSHVTCPVCRCEVESVPKPLPGSKAGPHQTNTNESHGTPHSRFRPSGESSGETSFSQSFASEKGPPGSEPYLDVELGQNGRGPRTSVSAGRESQQDGVSAVN